MKIISFRVQQCFGFVDSNQVSLEDESNLIYVLGKNSSGKTMFLTALDQFNWDKVPSQHPNCRNLGADTENGWLVATFTLESGDFSPDTFAANVRAYFVREAIHLDVRTSERYAALVAQVVDDIKVLYQAWLEALLAVGAVQIRKNVHGIYQMAGVGQTDEDLSRSYSEQLAHVIDIVQGRFPNNQFTEGAQFTLSLEPAEIMRLLYKHLPPIALINRDKGLAEDLPERIVLDTLAAPRPLLSAFLQLIGEQRVRAILDTLDLRVQVRELNAMQREIDAVTDQISVWRQVNPNDELDDLLRLQVHMHREGGIQISAVTSGEKYSLYRHISDATKVLFAYFLYRKTGHLAANVLLFDEPDAGLHPTAQEHLFQFLLRLGQKKELGGDNKLVVISTHSEYLLDPDHLTGVRLMGVRPNDQSLMVRPHFHDPSGQPGDDLALRPIMDAIGLKYGTAKLGIHNNVIITEGITDLYYYRAFNKLLGSAAELHIAPGRGDDKILNIVALVISQGLAFKIVLDTQPSDSKKALIQARYGIPDQFFYEVPLPATSAFNKGSGVEDLFSKDDFEKLLTRMGWTVPTTFSTMSNAEYMKSKAKKALAAPSTAPSKRLLAEWFVQEVNAGRLSLADFDPTTVGQFKAALDFCHNADWCLL